jgi:hypothetical protein
VRAPSISRGDKVVGREFFDGFLLFHKRNEGEFIALVAIAIAIANCHTYHARLRQQFQSKTFMSFYHLTEHRCFLLSG